MARRERRAVAAAPAAPRAAGLGLALLLLVAASLTPASSAAPARVLARKKASGATAIAWRGIRTACDASPACAPLPAHTEEDCVLACQAPSCHAAVYAGSPLEPGEVDARCDPCSAECRGAAPRPRPSPLVTESPSRRGLSSPSRRTLIAHSRRAHPRATPPRQLPPPSADERACSAGACVS